MRVTLFLFLTSCSLLPVGARAEQEPEGRAQFITASRAYHGERYADCITGYQMTIDLHFEVPFSKMMIGRCFGLQGDIDKAIQALDEAAEFEFVGAQMLRVDADFDAVRNDPRFADIVAKVQSNAAPCAPRARRHQFDFWIGQWDVFDARGRNLGTDRVESAEGGCAIRESWTDAAGGTGESLTYYSRLTALWRQVWMDPTGQQQDLSGEVVDGAIVLRQITYSGGLKSILQVTYAPLPDGTVRQLAQRSVDEGQTWNALSDLVFKPKAQ
jgi:hypothetical protein